jgi:hypothetical protein
MSWVVLFGLPAVVLTGYALYVIISGAPHPDSTGLDRHP